jgi:hypothetical protein
MNGEEPCALARGILAKASEEQSKRCEKLTRLTFAKKTEIVSKMQKAGLIRRPGEAQGGTRTGASFETAIKEAGEPRKKAGGASRANAPFAYCLLPLEV